MSANIDTLPNELLLFIFKHLNIQDLVHCRSVCKRFLFLCHEVKISELQISNIIENVKYYSFHTYKQFNYKDAIDVPRFTTYRMMFRLGEFLKRLHFKGNISDFYQLNLNDLTQLVDLKICLALAGYNDKIHLNLPNLKALEICDYSCDFYLTTPKLKILKCVNFNEMHIADLSTIERLELVNDTIKFPLMENVQILKIQLASPGYENVNFSYFPKLKMLFYHNLIGDYLHDIFELKLQKPELKIYVESVELIDSGKVDEYKSKRTLKVDNFDWISQVAFQINNYDLLCDQISDLYPLFYNQVMSLVGGTLPNDFYNKYANVAHITVSGKVENQIHLLGFLKRFDYLSTLRIQDTVLDQSFFDCLEIGQLTELTVTNCPIVNYDFLLKFKLLKSFLTLNDADLFDLSFQLFRRLKYFEYIWFGFNEESVRMERERDDRMDRTEYMFSHHQDRRTLQQMNFDDFDQLVHAVTAYKIQKSTNRSD